MNRMKLIELGKAFLDNKISAEKFAEDIVVERRKLYGVDDPNKAVSQCGGELFIIADCYNPDPDRDSYELDAAGLRKEVKATLEKFNFFDSFNPGTWQRCPVLFHCCLIKVYPKRTGR